MPHRTTRRRALARTLVAFGVADAIAQLDEAVSLPAATFPERKDLEAARAPLAAVRQTVLAGTSVVAHE